MSSGAMGRWEEGKGGCKWGGGEEDEGRVYSRNKEVLFCAASSDGETLTIGWVCFSRLLRATVP